MDFSFKLNGEQLFKLVKSAVIVALGAGLLYGLEGLGKLDFGIYTPLVGAACTWLVNLVKVFFKI